MTQKNHTLKRGYRLIRNKQTTAEKDTIKYIIWTCLKKNLMQQK